MTKCHLGSQSGYFKSPKDFCRVDARYLSNIDKYALAFASKAFSDQKSLAMKEVTNKNQMTHFLHPKTIIPYLKSLFPEIVLEEFSAASSSALSGSDMLDNAYLKFLTFLATNDFPGLNDEKLGQILKTLQFQTSEKLHLLFQSIQGPDYTAIAERLFQCAIKAGNTQVVEFLLQDSNACIDINRCIEWNHRDFTPIQLSSHLQHNIMTKILIRCNADVNKFYSQDQSWPRRALEEAISCNYADLELVQIFLDADAIVDSETLDGCIQQGNVETVELLVRARAQDCYEKWMMAGEIESAIASRSSKKAMRIIEIFSNVSANLPHGCKPIQLKETLDEAALRGDFAFVLKLLNISSAVTENTLVCAIQSENMNLMRYIIGYSAKVHGLTTFSSSPLVEAVRLQNFEITRLLLRKGSFGRIKEQSRFDAVMKAAAEAGNVEIVKALLVLAVHTPNLLKGSAKLEAAIEAGQQEIALLLIDAGAELTSLSLALKQQNIAIVQAMILTSI